MTRSIQVDAARYWVGARLVDSLLHEARNPLNALSIHLGILQHKLKAPRPAASSALGTAGPSSAMPEKNLDAMREQLSRVDEILRLFSEFIAPRPAITPDVDFSDLVQRGVQVLGHEARQSQVTVVSQIAPGIRLRTEGTGPQFLATFPLLRAIARSSPGSSVAVVLSQASGRLRFTVSDSSGPSLEPFDQALDALDALCREHGGTSLIQPSGALELELPEASLSQGKNSP